MNIKHKRNTKLHRIVLATPDSADGAPGLKPAYSCVSGNSCTRIPSELDGRDSVVTGSFGTLIVTFDTTEEEVAVVWATDVLENVLTEVGVAGATDIGAGGAAVGDTGAICTGTGCTGAGSDGAATAGKVGAVAGLVIWIETGFVIQAHRVVIVPSLPVNLSERQSIPLAVDKALAMWPSAKRNFDHESFVDFVSIAIVRARRFANARLICRQSSSDVRKTPCEMPVYLPSTLSVHVMRSIRDYVCIGGSLLFKTVSGVPLSSTGIICAVGFSGFSEK